jgi:phospholipid/cholesterol/gamma-HCH transport system permease protein
LRGPLNIETTPELHETFGRLAGRRDLGRIVIDFEGVTDLDTSAIATFSLAIDRLKAAGVTVRAEHLTDDQREALDLMPSDVEPAEQPEDLGFFESFGTFGIQFLNDLDYFYDVTTDTAFSALEMLKGAWPPKGSVTRQSVRIGVDALPIVGLLSFLLGLILAFQSAYQLRQFGANIYVANLVGIAMVREFGPMMTAIILAGRSGSSMAAELGTMQVQEEIDALKTMGIDPNRYLILPRMIAITLMQPALTLLSDFIGILGGYVIANLYLDLSSTIYLNKTIEAVQMGDFFHGIGKSFLFAWLIGLIACFSGMMVRGGASGVGRATTRSVVIGIFMIIVTDSIVTTVATLL